MARLRPVNSILLRMILSLPITFALSLLFSVPLYPAVGHIGVGCADSLTAPSVGYYMYDSLNVGLPIPWFTISQDGCGRLRSTRVVIHWEGLILFAVIALVGYWLASQFYTRWRRGHRRTMPAG